MFDETLDSEGESAMASQIFSSAAIITHQTQGQYLCTFIRMPQDSPVGSSNKLCSREEEKGDHSMREDVLLFTLMAIIIGVQRVEEEKFNTSSNCTLASNLGLPRTAAKKTVCKAWVRG